MQQSRLWCSFSICCAVKMSEPYYQPKIGGLQCWVLRVSGLGFASPHPGPSKLPAPWEGCPVSMRRRPLLVVKDIESNHLSIAVNFILLDGTIVT